MKKKHFKKRKFSKTRNAVSESETTKIEKIQNLKVLIDKSNPIEQQKYFSDSQRTTPSSIKG